jgi:histone deacetylase 6
VSQGGYNLDAISVSALAVAQVLLGETPEELGSMQASDLCVEVVNQVAKAQSKYWKNIDLKACEPPEVGSANDASVVTIPDILKVFRGDVLRRKHGLFPIPLANLELEEAFSEQIFSNMDLAGSSADKPLVLFVHDFGNLRVERNSSLSSDAHMTNSYLLDTSDTVVKWVINNRWDLIDVNVLRQLPTSFAVSRTKPTKLTYKEGPKMVSNRGDPADGELLRYLWENLIE